MTRDIITIDTRSVGQLANEYARQTVFPDYQGRKSEETMRRQKADLKLFSKYLAAAGLVDPVDFLDNPSSWGMITHGLVDGFLRWQLQQGYAIGSINVRLSTIKKYCALAARAGAMESTAFALISLVKGYTHKEGRNIDERRDVTRVGEKKAEVVIISKEQSERLKQQPDTPQGRRDSFLVCLLLDHGLRCGEIAGLTTTDLNIDTGILSFYREKVDKTQRHELTRDTLVAAHRYFEIAKPQGSLLMGSRKGGFLQGRMSERAITARMKVLCKRIGVVGASAHDGRHAWASFAVAGGTNIKALQDAGGWSSPAMPLRYAASQEIVNKEVRLG